MIGWALNAILGATLLMLLVLAVRRPVAHAFGAGWAYALWFLPLFRLLTPPISLPGGLLPSELPRYTVIIPTVGEAAASSPPVAGGPGQWVPLLLALWAGGAAVFFLWQQSSYGAFLLHLGRDGRRAVPPEYGGIPVVGGGRAARSRLPREPDRRSARFRYTLQRFRARAGARS